VSTLEEKRPTEQHSEADYIPVARLAGWVVGLLFALIVVVVVLVRVFASTTQQEIFAKQIAPVPADVSALRAKEAAELNGYGVVDKAAGLYHIPIEQAIEYLVAHPDLIAARPKAELRRGGK
jgi:hypothetical protein